jgi:hypothetical protein
MKKRRVLAVFLAVAMVFCFAPMTAIADSNTQAFMDMPEEGFWSTTALEAAVSNGLLNGFLEDGNQYLKPDSHLTRAQMATVVNRAFGAYLKAELTGVKDVYADNWYSDEMKKAVYMGTMKLDTVMRPDDNITRQEAFTILGRALKMTNGKAQDLAKFSDSSNVATWAVGAMGAMVKAGYIQGDNNMLTPTANMTRAQFAVVMDNIIKEYIRSGGTVTSVVASGNVMVNVPGVTLKNLTVNGHLIIGDGVGDGNIILDNVTLKGDLIARGGGVNSIIIKGGSVTGKVIISKVNGEIRVTTEDGAIIDVEITDGGDDIIIEGNIGTLEVTVPDIPVVIQNATVQNVEVVAESVQVTVAQTATVTTVNVQSTATGTNVVVAGTVTTVNTQAPQTAVSGTGTVTTVNVQSGANNTSITTPSTSITVASGTEGVTAGGDKPVEGGSTATNTSDGSDIVATPTPGGGAAGGGGGTPPATPVIDIVDVKVSNTSVLPTSGLYIIPMGATKDNTSIDVSITSIADTTFTAAMSIKKGSTELASASAVGISADNVRILNLAGYVEIGDLSKIVTKLGSNVEGRYWNGTAWVEKSGSDANQAALNAAIDDMYSGMNNGETYTVTITLTPSGGSAGSKEFTLRKEWLD